MNEHLQTYLNDHLAGSVAGVELARRCHTSNPEGALGDFLAVLAREIEEDQGILESLVKHTGGINRVKTATGWLGEKLSRAKLNDALSEYSDLSRLEELEALLLGVRGKLALWTVLEATVATQPPFADIDFSRLKSRAEGQLEGLEHHRLEAARLALSPK